MTKGNEFNIDMNSSSAIVTPTRSEIRIELPTITIPTWKLPTRSAVMHVFRTIAIKAVHPLALLSAFLCSTIRILEVEMSKFPAILFILIAFISFNASFFLILKNVIAEEDATEGKKGK